MGDYDDYLKSLDEQHNPEGVPEQGFAKYPDQDYMCIIDKLYVGKSKNKETIQTVWEFEIMSGPYSFRKIMKFSAMDTAQRLDFLTNDLRRVGITNFKWSNVQEQFVKVLDKLVLLTLKTKTDKTDKTKSYQSVYIQRLLDQNEVLVGDGLKSEGDVPF